MSSSSQLSAAPPLPAAEIQWEETACPLCNGRQSTSVVAAPDPAAADAGPRFIVVRCTDCGLCFTNPRPKLASIQQFYSDTYGPHQVRGPTEENVHHADAGWHGARRYGQVSWHGDGRLLDVGCGAGEFMHHMHLAGWHVTGLDLSTTVVERIRRQLKLRALAGSLPHAELKPGSFDVVTMWQSLEHFHQPLETLRHIHDLLAPGGKLFVATPNLDCGSFRFFGASWYGLDLPRHLIHFTPVTLRAMLARAGFKVESFAQVRRPSWLRASARLAERRGAGPVWKHRLDQPTLGRLAAFYFHLRGRSDTILSTASKAGHAGAGHEWDGP